MLQMSGLSTLTLVCVMSLVASDTFHRVCYLRPSPPLPLEPVLVHHLCTHIIVGFIEIDAHSRVSFSPSFGQFLQASRASIDRLNPSVKLMVSVGGGGAGGFPLATSSVSTRSQFIDSVCQSLQVYSLDGVDIDWEFPNWGKANLFDNSEKYNFVHLLRGLRSGLDALEWKTGRRHVLSVAVPAQVTIISRSYLPGEMSKSVDFINLMTYDFYIHKWYWPWVGHNSALHARGNEYGFYRMFNTNWAAHHWAGQGMPKSKIMVGIPTYAKRFYLSSPFFNKPGALASSSQGDWTYSQVCHFLALNNTHQVFDRESGVPYAYNGHEWISYENEESATHKANWIRENGFGGAMLFSLNADDYGGGCRKDIPFPLHWAVRNLFFKT